MMGSHSTHNLCSMYVEDRLRRNKRDLTGCMGENKAGESPGLRRVNASVKAGSKYGVLIDE
jgi:hypothetical protein